MMNIDLQYVRRLIGNGTIQGQVLELGAGYGGETCKELVNQSGLDCFSTDLPGCPNNVDYPIYFLDEASHLPEIRFDTILVLNVLEHVFDPVTLLDRAALLLKPKGAMVLLSPASWQIHQYPIDCSRLYPDWYREYARRRRMEIINDSFCYVSTLQPISHEFCTGEFLPRIQSDSLLKRYWSAAIHKIFNTEGRQLYTLSTPQEAIAVALRKP